MALHCVTTPTWSTIDTAGPSTRAARQSSDVAGIILSRWGHAYVNPQPGFFFGIDGKPAPRDVLRERLHGRIAFANIDLAGAMDHRSSIREADRAAMQLLGA